MTHQSATAALNVATVLEEVRGIAGAAGDAIMSIYARDFSVQMKADRSPVTAADRAADGIISAGLSQLSPTLPVLSEESAPISWSQRRHWQRYWLVDPLDGTKEFVKKNGEFTVNIALIEDHRAVLGVVRAPALNVEFSGMVGKGAWRRRDRETAVPVQASRNPTVPLQVMGSRSHPGPGLHAYLERLGPYELKPMGSSLKICLVADGHADIYPRLGPTSEWDTAAAQAILESAGGGMIDLAGQPLRYNTKDRLTNPHFLAVGNPAQDWLGALHS